MSINNRSERNAPVAAALHAMHSRPTRTVAATGRQNTASAIATRHRTAAPKISTWGSHDGRRGMTFPVSSLHRVGLDLYGRSGGGDRRVAQAADLRRTAADEHDAPRKPRPRCFVAEDFPRRNRALRPRPGRSLQNAQRRVGVNRGSERPDVQALRPGIENEGGRVVADPQDLDGKPGPRLISGQDQERYAAYLAVGIAGKCDGAEAAAALRDCGQGADRTGRPPDVGRLDRPARQDRRAGRHFAGGRVQHKAEHRGRALERVGDGGVTVGQLVREVGDARRDRGQGRDCGRARPGKTGPVPTAGCRCR